MGKVQVSKLSKEQLFKKVVELEEELHQANNSTDYWNYEYNQLLARFQEMDKSDDPVLKFLQDCNIIQKEQLLNFIKDLTR